MGVGIIGAGVTGLATSLSLDRAGVDHVVFEATDQPGGVIRSRTVDGRVLDYGPQRLRMTPAVEALVDELGLSNETRSPAEDRPLFVYADERLREVPLDLPTFLRTDLLSWRGKLRLLAEPLTAPGRPEESVRDLLVRKFGREAARTLFGPLVGGIYGSDPVDMVAGYALPRLLAMEDRHGSLVRGVLSRALSDERPDTVTFTDGMQTLPKAIARSVRDRIRFGTPVESIRSGPTGYELVVPGGRFTVDAVAVTTPASVAADLLRPVAHETAVRLDRLTYRPMVVVHLTGTLDRPGMGYQVRRDEGLRTLGVTWNAPLFGRDGVFTCFLADGPGWPDRSDRALGACAREEFEHVTGAEATVLDVTRLRPGMPAYDRSWRALAAIDPPRGIHLAGSYDGGPGIPSRVRAARSLADEVALDTDVPTAGKTTVEPESLP